MVPTEPTELGEDYACFPTREGIRRLRFVEKIVITTNKFGGAEHTQVTVHQDILFRLFDPTTDESHKLGEWHVLWPWKDHPKVTRGTGFLNLPTRPSQKYVLAGPHQWSVSRGAWRSAADQLGVPEAYLSGWVRIKEAKKRFPWEDPKRWLDVEDMVRFGLLVERVKGAAPEEVDTKTAFAEPAAPNVIGMTLAAAKALLEEAGWKVFFIEAAQRGIYREDRWRVDLQIISKHHPPAMTLVCSKLKGGGTRR